MHQLYSKLPCIMDPVITGLSLDSPWMLSLGKALLINPEGEKTETGTVSPWHRKDKQGQCVYSVTHKQYPPTGLLLCPCVLGPWVPPSCWRCVSAHDLFGGCGCFPWGSWWLLVNKNIITCVPNKEKLLFAISTIKGTYNYHRTRYAHFCLHRWRDL